MSISTESKRGGILGWFKSLFSIGAKEESWEERLQLIIIKLEDQKHKLDQLFYRMNERAKELFEQTIEHLKKARSPRIKPEEREAHMNLAKTFAEEVYEIRAFLKAIKFTSAVINKAILRLQTVKDVKDFQQVLLPISQLIAGVKEEIGSIFPNVGETLDEIRRSIDELMLHTSTSVQSIPSPTVNISKEIDAILEEAWRVATKSVDEAVPEPSNIIKKMMPERIKVEKESLVENTKRRETKPISVYVEQKQTKTRKTEKEPVELRTPTLNTSLIKLEQLILDEIRVNKGKFNINEFVDKYGFDRDKVFEALYNLSKKGKIRIVRRI